MKKILSIFLIIALLVGIMPTTTLATVHSSNNSTISNDSFISEVSNITNKYQNDNYFSSITMVVGEDGMMVDGEKKDSMAAVKNNGELMLPIVDIAKSMDVPTSVDKQTGEIVINGKEIADVPTIATSSLNAANLNSSSENSYTNTHSYTYTYTNTNLYNSEMSSIVNNSKMPGVTNIETLPNGTQIYSMPDGSKLAKTLLVNEKETENALGLDVHVDGNNITITKPYQTKELIVQTNGATLSNTFGCIDSAYDGKGMYLLQYSTEDATRNAEHAIKSFSYVKTVQPNGMVHTTGITGEWGETRVQADRYKPIASAAGGTTIVAVLDTGVDVTHELLTGRTVPGFDFVDNDSSPEDVFGHGTHVSGIIANNTPSNVKIMPIKVLNDKGSGYLLTIKLGIEYAISHGANVINMSLGGTSYANSDPVLEGVSEAVDAGVTVVVAAGNDNSSTDNVTPAKSDKAITVAASTDSDTRSPFSNYGKAVDIAAPGMYIKSSIPDNNYASWSGTSMATPFVAAAVAMQKLVHPSYSPVMLKTAVESATVDCGTPGRDNVFGAGVLDYGILLGDNVPAGTISVIPQTINFQDDSLTQQSQNIDIYVYPLNATNKSYTVINSNPSVAIFQDGKIVAKSAGTATSTFTLANKADSTTCVVKVAKTEKWINYHANSYAGGNGSQSSPYLISNTSQLAKLAYDTRIGGNLFENTYFKLTADIDLLGKQWSSIMYAVPDSDGWTTIYPFKGNFDGANHKIKNMTIQQPKDGVSDITNYYYAGLFGFTAKGYIKNLAVTDAFVDINFGGGILAGESGYGQIIDNNYTSGYSSGSGFINSECHSYISNCFSTAETRFAGFIRSINGGIINNCYASGSVTSADENSGGFAGSNVTSDHTETTALIVNAFATNITPSGIGFLEHKIEVPSYPSACISKSYYNADNPFGISNDENKGKTDLTAKSIAFFKTKNSYTTVGNWNSKYAWDFTNKWAIDPSLNNGFPYLKSLGAPTNKTSAEPSNSWIDYAANSYAGGNGTKAAPYLISTPQQLARIAKIHRYGGGKYMYYKLTSNIDLSGHDWLPIGYGKTVDSNLKSSSFYTHITDPYYINRSCFSGNILGNGYTISNMNININGDVVGFVSDLAGGIMKDLSFINSKVSGKDIVGVVAGINCNGAKISNCKVSGEVYGNINVGGFVGYNDFDGELNSDTANTSVIGTSYLGGLTSVNLGYINTSFSTSILNNTSEIGTLVYANRGTISNSYSKSRLTDGTFVNGLGKILQSGRIINSYSFGSTPMFYSDCRGDSMQQGVEMTDDQMKQLSTFDGWNFNTIWGIDPQKNDGYPYLKLPVAIPDSVLPTTAWEDYKATSFEGGNGSPSSPYLIKTPHQLAYMVYGIFHGIFPDGSSYKLVSDIDLSGHLWLGSYDLLPNINLYFDGDGHTVNNMIMNNGFGLFGNIGIYTNSVVKNLGITNIKGIGIAAIAYCSSGKIINCYATGSIRDINRWGAGGLVAHNDGLVEYCYSTCNVSSYYNVGGLVGNDNNGKVLNSYLRGNIYCTNSGYGITKNSSNCYSTGIIVGSGQPLYYDDSVISSYYDKDTACVDWTTGRLTTEMKTQSTYVDWDFNNIWGIDASVNDGYPFLKYNYNGLPSYTVSYDTNGGTGTIASQRVRYASNINMPSESTLAKSGRVCTGWSISPSGQGKLYSPSAIFTIPQNDVKLYAQWAVACTITFNANGGIGDTTKTFAYNKVLTTSPTTPTRSGYTFDGWYTSQSGGTLITFPYTVNGDVTFYAHWNVNTYSVQFNANGGTSVNPIIRDYGKTIDKAPTTCKEGSTFTGWYTAQNGGSKVAFPYKVSDNATLYAHWNSLIPATPTSIKAVSTNYNTIKITWAKAANSNQDKVYRATNSAGPYTLVGTVSTLTFTDTSLTAGKKYYYKIMACNMANGRTSGYSNVVSVTPLPASLKLSTVKKTSSTSAKLSYVAVSGASGYEVWYGTTSASFKLAGTSTKTSYTKKKLTVKKVYYFKVRAYRKVGTKKVYGAFSNVKLVRM